MLVLTAATPANARLTNPTGTVYFFTLSFFEVIVSICPDVFNTHPPTNRTYVYKRIDCTSIVYADSNKTYNELLIPSIIK